MKRTNKSQENKIVIPGIVVAIIILLLATWLLPNYSFIIFGIGALSIPTAVFSKAKIFKTILIVISVGLVALIVACLYMAHEDDVAMDKIIEAEQNNITQLLSQTPAISTAKVVKEDDETIKFTYTLAPEGEKTINGELLLATQSTDEFKTEMEKEVKEEVGNTYLPSTVHVHYLMYTADGQRYEENTVKLEF